MKILGIFSLGFFIYLSIYLFINPPGYCSSGDIYYEDKEIIYWGIDNIKSLIKGYSYNQYTPEKYLKEHKECCKLFRDRTFYLSRIFSNKKNAYDVEIKYEINSEDGHQYSLTYLKFDPCGKLLDRKTIGY